MEAIFVTVTTIETTSKKLSILTPDGTLVLIKTNVLTRPGITVI